MLLAGLIGTLIFEFAGIELFLDKGFSWSKLMLVSAVGTLLPVPMTFDVIFTQKLLGSETNISYVAALLCTLGIFSVYPFMLFWKTYSKKIAISILTAVWIMGVFAGGYIHYHDQSLLTNLPIEQYKKDPVHFIQSSIEKYCNGKEKFDFCQKHFSTAFAIKLNDANICNNIKKADYKLDCEYSVRVKKLGLDYEKCDKFEDPKRCFSKLIGMIIKIKLFKVLPCEKRGNANDPICKDLIYLTKNTASTDDLNCSLIQNREIKDKCYAILTSMISRFNSTLKKEENRFSIKCDQIQNKDLADICYLKIAQSTRNNKWCEPIAKDRLRVKNECLVKAQHGPFNETTKESECNIFKDQKLKSICINEIKDTQYALQMKFLIRINSFGYEDTQDDLDDTSSLSTFVKPNSPPIALHSILQNKSMSLKSFEHKKRNNGSTPFTKDYSDKIGMKSPSYYIDDLDNFSRGYGISSGDLNNDHWQDVVLGSFQELNIYINTGGKFEKIPALFKEKFFKQYQIYIAPINTALVDINNDGWLDIFVSNHDGNLFFILNDKNYFSNPEFILLPRHNREWGISTAFADLDNNGFLDVFVGNGQGSIIDNLFLKQTSGENNSNEIFFNMNGSFKYQKLNDNFGVTLTTLASDINNDGFIDLVAGNDFEASDMFYFGKGNGEFKEIRPADKIFTTVTAATMSYDSGDFDNDLKLETYAVAMKRGIFFSTNYCSQFNAEVKEKCDQVFSIGASIKSFNLSICDNINESGLKNNCYAKGLMFLAIRFNDKGICRLIPSSQFATKLNCEKRFFNRKYLPLDEKINFKQANRNILFKQNDNGSFDDLGQDLKIDNTHWGWNTKFADLDNDTWLDIYAANGRFRVSEIASNVFFHNLKGSAFKEETKDFGLVDFVDTSAFVYNDYDLDGDLDIFSQGFLSPIRFFRNNNSDNNSITISLIDHKGNRFGVNAKVYITFIENNKEKTIMRELKAGGGFASYDPFILHFGLGKVTSISKIVVHWPYGNETIVDQKLPANRHYEISRL
jgi:hypothetical protein